VENGVLTARDNEHNVLDSMGDNEVAYWLLLNLGNVWETHPGGTDPNSWPYFRRGWGPNFLLLLNHSGLYCYNCILLMKTKSIIYICYMFCTGSVEIIVLTVRDIEYDSEHTVRNDEVTSSDVAGEGTAWETVGSHAWIVLGNRP